MDELEIRILDNDDLPQHNPALEKGRFKIWGTPQSVTVQVLCSQKVVKVVEDFSKQNNKEVGGILLGNAYRYEGNIYIEITECIKAKVYSTQQSSAGFFNFTEDTWAEMLRTKDEHYEKLRIVGWFHSHPGHGIFLSKGMDTFIQDHYFSRPWQVAMVYDPYQHHGGFFVWEQSRILETPGFFEIFDENVQGTIVSWKNLRIKEARQSLYDWVYPTLIASMAIILIGSFLFLLNQIAEINRRISDQGSRLHSMESTMVWAIKELSTPTPSNTNTPTETITPTLTPTTTTSPTFTSTASLTPITMTLDLSQPELTATGTIQTSTP